MENGELIVASKGRTYIDLTSKEIHEVLCYFLDPIETPCNPQHADLLEYEVVKAHKHHHARSHWVLAIKWDVSTVRTIVWEVH